MNYEELRMRHKTILVERVFGIYPPGEDIEAQKRIWVKKLFDGYDVQEFLKLAKKGLQPNAEEQVVEDGQGIGSLVVVDKDLSFFAGLKRKLRVDVRNDSGDVFRTTDTEPLFAAYHWYNSDGSIHTFDGIRTRLPEPISHGKNLIFSIDVLPPSDAGRYLLEVTMVYEARHWMEEIGFLPQKLEIDVKEYEGEELTSAAKRLMKFWDECVEV